jgi:hypothetical protein
VLIPEFKECAEIGNSNNDVDTQSDQYGSDKETPTTFALIFFMGDYPASG